MRISGFFRDAFPHQIDLFDRAVRRISELEEDEDANPLAARVRRERAEAEAQGVDAELAKTAIDLSHFRFHAGRLRCWTTGAD